MRCFSPCASGSTPCSASTVGRPSCLPRSVKMPASLAQRSGRETSQSGAARRNDHHCHARRGPRRLPKRRDEPSSQAAAMFRTYLLRRGIMNRAERLNAVLELLAVTGQLEVEDIITTLGVSAATARRDLDALASQQLLTRTRGARLRR